MKLTKDEAAIVALIFNYGYHSFNHDVEHENKEMSFKAIDCLEQLKRKLEEAGKDQRRIGRTSRNNTRDLLYRLIEKSNDNGS